MEEICYIFVFTFIALFLISHIVFVFLSLRPLDVEFMRRLSKVVNIVPVIAKADTLTLEERDFFKKKVTFVFLLILYFLHLLTRILSQSTSIVFSSLSLHSYIFSMFVVQ